MIFYMILSVLWTPVTENTTHSAIFTAWSPIRSKYFATMRVSMAFSPFALSAAISSIYLILGLYKKLVYFIVRAYDLSGEVLVVVHIRRR